MEDTTISQAPRPYANPYLAGLLLGAVLLASFLVLGAGLGASSAITRAGAYAQSCVAPVATSESEYFGALGPSPLRYYLVFMFVGTFAGGLLSALLANRVTPGVVERGRRASPWLRLSLALAGGVIAGFASRIGGGCTSGQALSGGAMLLSGSLVFLACVFAGGYATALLARRQWND